MAPLVEEFFFLELEDAIEHHDDHMIDALPPRCVSFGGPVVSTSIYDIVSRFDFSAQEIKDSWYDRHDLRRMKDQVRSDVKLMESGQLVDSNDDLLCSRGLESKTKHGMRRKRQTRRSAINSVLMEFDCQEDAGLFDEEAIADAYYMYSEQCLVAAHVMGLRDEIDANNVWEPSARLIDFLKNEYAVQHQIE